MLDPKYALKYKMPHSLLHIVDNSMYTGQLTPTVADDPSLYATIVVSGSPIGVDNRFVNLTRSDIASISFGLGGITTDDIKRFGQSVEYPLSLIQNSNTPVRFMRVTPEGSTFAVYTLLVQWKIETDTNGKSKMLVRFIEQPVTDLPSLRLDRFKNPERLNAAIITNTEPEADGWNQAVLMNIISAGRGKAYNDMAFAIDLGKQQKRALNVRYLFNTINTITTQVIESFSASLVNNNVFSRVTTTSTPIESVNVAVGRRMDGSSILVPFVNEDVVNTVFTAYTNMINNQLGSLTETEQKIFKTTNINTFDILFGTYVYDGMEYDLKLPCYQVEMYNPDIARLDEQHRVISTKTEDVNPEETPGEELYAQLIDAAYGIKDPDESTTSLVHIGDLFLASATGYVRPYMTFVAAINQYTGAITPFQFSSLYVTDVSTPITTDTVYPKTAEIIAYIIDGTVDKDNTVIKRLIANGTMQPGQDYYIAQVDESDAVTPVKFYLVKFTVEAGVITWTQTEVLNTVAKIRKRLPWPKNQKIVIPYTDPVSDAFTDITSGLTVVDTTGAVYVCGYSSEAIAVTAASIRYGTCPSYVSITNDLMGVDYDVLWYSGDSTGATVSIVGAAEYEDQSRSAEIDIASGGSGFAVDDILKFAGTTAFPNARFKVTAVNGSGAIENIVSLGASDELTSDAFTIVTGTPTSASLTYADSENPGSGTGASITVQSVAYVFGGTPEVIKRWTVTGSQGSLYRVQLNPIEINADYYTANYGVNPIAELGGLRMQYGSTGFFDETLDPIEFKYRYSALLVQAYKGQIDPKILSPIRCPAKYLFDGGTNTIISQVILPNTNYDPIDLINASTIFTDEEKDRIVMDPTIVTDRIEYPAVDIDVKQAMYDLMIERVYLRIPEDKRPIGPGYGLSLHLDSGVTDATTVAMINTSFAKRFTNPNASWDIGGYTSAENGITYTFTKNLADNLIAHCKANTVNKPYVMSYATIASDQYTSYFPDIDLTDWDMRENLYANGGNAWVPDINGNLVRRSQRTMQTYEETSDLVQESNMRTLSQLCYLLQNKIDEKLFEYDDDDVLKTVSDEINNMFSNWRGNLVQDLEIRFERDTNPTDGGEIVVCYCNVTFRGLILRVPIIVNVQRRTTT